MNPMIVFLYTCIYASAWYEHKWYQELSCGRTCTSYTCDTTYGIFVADVDVLDRYLIKGEILSIKDVTALYSLVQINDMIFRPSNIEMHENLGTCTMICNT